MLKRKTIDTILGRTKESVRARRKLKTQQTLQTSIRRTTTIDKSGSMLRTDSKATEMISMHKL